MPVQTRDGVVVAVAVSVGGVWEVLQRRVAGRVGVLEGLRVGVRLSVCTGAWVPLTEAVPDRVTRGETVPVTETARVRDGEWVFKGEALGLGLAVQEGCLDEEAEGEAEREGEGVGEGALPVRVRVGDVRVREGRLAVGEGEVNVREGEGEAGDGVGDADVWEGEYESDGDVGVRVQEHEGVPVPEKVADEDQVEVPEREGGERDRVCGTLQDPVKEGLQVKMGEQEMESVPLELGGVAVGCVVGDVEAEEVRVHVVYVADVVRDGVVERVRLGRSEGVPLGDGVGDCGTVALGEGVEWEGVVVTVLLCERLEVRLEVRSAVKVPVAGDKVLPVGVNESVRV